MQWLYQNLVSEIIFLLLVAGYTALIAVLKKRGSEWVTPLLYGVGAGATLLAIGLMLAAWRSLPPPPTPPVTPENVQSKIREWLDTFGASTRVVEDPNLAFVFAVTLPTGVRVTVGRSKKMDRYIIIQGDVHVSRLMHRT